MQRRRPTGQLSFIVDRIYDILMDFKTLVHTDQWVTRLLAQEKFRKMMSTSEMNYRIGLNIGREQQKLGLDNGVLLFRLHAIYSIWNVWFTWSEQVLIKNPIERL